MNPNYYTHAQLIAALSGVFGSVLILVVVLGLYDMTGDERIATAVIASALIMTSGLMQAILGAAGRMAGAIERSKK